MSMILDALTRAEHERQLENQPDLKFVTPVKPQNNNPNKIWLWIGLAVLANALILFFVIRALSGDAENEIEVASASPESLPDIATVQQQTVQQVPQSQPMKQEPFQELSTDNPVPNLQPTPQIQNPVSEELRPLAMEVNQTQAPEVDRPLVYEAKQANAKPPAPKTIVELNTAKASSKGNVSFSSTELSTDESAPVVNKPKLLINGVSDRPNSGNVPSVRDLPESSRSRLSQYEVNVHVYDDEPIRRFVLINMDKYKEGDRIANNGPLVEEITSAGVVVDYGSGRALLPPK
ncbi:MAG: general secretion pathway protein GspB [Gammaproteobacteria bacterium]